MSGCLRLGRCPRHGSESASSHPAPCQKDVRRGVRRRDRGQRPTATKNPDPKLRRRRLKKTGHPLFLPARRNNKWVSAIGSSTGFHTWPPSHIPQDTAPNPLLRIRSPAKKTFGAATGVSDPRLQKIRIRNHGAGGKAATVAGDDGPGFHNWPGSADVLVGEYETGDSHPKKRRSERRSAPRPGSATHGYRRPKYETAAQAAKPPL